MKGAGPDGEPTVYNGALTAKYATASLAYAIAKGDEQRISEFANGISVGFTSHYDTMRARFGEHLLDGLAGENILVRADRPFGEVDLAGGLLVETAGGATARLDRVIVATPCVEFTRFALRHPDDARTDRAVKEALIFLDGGMRGYYTRYSGDPVAIRPGDRVYRG